jgi:hypothetical protein
MVEASCVESALVFKATRYYSRLPNNHLGITMETSLAKQT